MKAKDKRQSFLSSFITASKLGFVIGESFRKSKESSDSIKNSFAIISIKIRLKIGDVHEGLCRSIGDSKID
jgi:hypothetical protein